MQGRVENPHVAHLEPSSALALDLTSFDGRLHLMAREGEEVQIGQPIAEDRLVKGRMFVSPAGGAIKEIIRGLKRKILYVVIEKADREKYFSHGPLDAGQASKKEIINKCLQSGLLTKVRSRPCNVLPSPNIYPHSIFVKALESAPFAPDPSLEVEGFEQEFQHGLEVLSYLAQVHLVYRKGCTSKAFTDAEYVKKHTAEGPHPIGNFSVHIYHIDPIFSSSRCIWTLTVNDVISFGKLFMTGQIHHTKIISVAGEGIKKEKRCFMRIREGQCIEDIVKHRLEIGRLRVVSGDPLMGKKVNLDEFIGMSDNVVCALFENQKRQPFHFLRLGRNKYSVFRAYLSGFFPKKDYVLTTNQHGEERAFVEASIYDKVMPMRIPTVHLIKALLANDFELAEELGLLEIAEEDFALPAFICPSKVEMVQIVKNALRNYAEQYLAS